MSFGILEGIAAAGVIGNFLNGQAANRNAGRVAGMQIALDKQRLRSLQELFNLAQGYNPSAETAQAGQFATDKASAALQNALAGLASRYTQSGGVPGLSSAYTVNAQRATDNILGPLAATLAELKANEYSKKMNAFALAAGSGPGQLGSSQFVNTYLQQAGSYGMAASEGLMQLVKMLQPQAKQQAGGA